MIEQVLKIPFYSNTPDDTHCFQAVFKMILGYFLPKHPFSWDELDAMSAKQAGMWTWPQSILISLDALGLEATMIEGFDGKAFIEKGELYLRDTFGSQVAEQQIKYSNIDEEREAYRKAYALGMDIQNRIPDVADIRGYFEKGYLISCNVNSQKLNGKDGYIGHFVLVLGVGDSEIMIHDPGLPADPERLVSIKAFLEAWSDPNDTARNLIAVRPKEKV